jgi:DNA-binding Lrp family transcriptional regulator
MGGGAALGTKAYVLIETTVGKNREVVAALRKMKEVCEVNTVTGPFDLIALVEADSLAGVGDVVTARIHPIPGITRTVTCLVMQS